MKLRKRLIVSTIALALASQFSALTARDSIDQGLIEEAMPVVGTSADGFLVEAPYINNLVVMNVRVYNQQGEQVLYVRSQGEPVELLAADLPDGRYRYQVNTVDLSPVVGPVLVGEFNHIRQPSPRTLPVTDNRVSCSVKCLSCSTGDRISSL